MPRLNFVVDEINERLSRSGSALQPLDWVSQYRINHSYRMSIQTNGRWYSDADDFFGTNNEGISEDAGTGEDPAYNRNFNGHLIPAGAKIVSLDFLCRLNSSDTFDLEILFNAYYPTDPSRWSDGITSNAHMTNQTLYRNLFLNPTDLPPMTGNLAAKRKRTIPIGFTMPTDGEVCMYIRPSTPPSVLRYIYVTKSILIELPSALTTEEEKSE